MVKPADRREAVGYIQQTYSISQRRACRLMRLSKSSFHYEPRPSNDEALRQRLRELSQKHRRWGVDFVSDQLSDGRGFVAATNGT